MDPDTVLTRTDNMTTAPVDEEIVILNLAKDNYVGLDVIGRRIWELLETPLSVEKLCERLSSEYAATKEQIVEDVLPFLDELESEGLVRVVSDSTA